MRPDCSEFQSQNVQIYGLTNIEDPVALLDRHLYGHPLAGLLWERQFEGLGWRKSTEWRLSFCSSKTRIVLVGTRGWHQNGGKKQNISPMWKKLMKLVDLGEPTSFLDHVHLGNEITFEKHRKKFQSRIFAGATDKVPGWEKLHAKTVAWSYDMEGNAQKCVEGYCELANKTTEQLYKVRSPCMDDHLLSKRNMNQLENCHKYARKLSWSACTWRELVCLAFFGQWKNLLDQSPNGKEFVTDV